MMKLPHLFAFALLLLFVSPAMAQQCPIMSIEGPDTTEEKLVVLKALISPGPRTQPQYRWRTSRGSIVAGDSTSQITLDTTGVEGTSIDVTVEAIGVPTSCSTIAQLTLRVIREQMICGVAFDQYGDISFEDEKIRLDNFAIQLMNQPVSQGYIVAYAGIRTYSHEAAERLLRAKNYLVRVRGIARERVVTIDAGHRTDLSVTLIIVPSGAEPPVFAPEVIPESELQLTKLRPKRVRF